MVKIIQFKDGIRLWTDELFMKTDTPTKLVKHLDLFPKETLISANCKEIILYSVNEDRIELNKRINLYVK